jgi:hypothetical protein
MQFINKFKNLVESSTNIGEVEIFLETDIRVLNEKLSPLKHVKEVSVTLIPPNDDKEDFEALFSTNSDEIKETNATKFDLSLFGTARRSINVASIYVQKWVKAIGQGYGKMSVIGRNNNGEEVTVRSEEEAPYRRPISENSKDSIPEVVEKTRAGIEHLNALKARGLIEEDGNKQ